MPRLRKLAAFLGIITLVAAGAAAADVTVAQAAGATVSVRETTADGSQLLAPQGGTSFALGAGSAGQTITMSTANGALLQQWACTGGPAQSFTLSPQT